VAPRLLLWDIDGTLVHAGAAAADAFAAAIADVVGVGPPHRLEMSGKTDPLIVAEHLPLAGAEADPATLTAVLDRLTVRLAEAEPMMVATGAACPGVPELLRALAVLDGVACGVLTGNLRANAEVKLRAFGLDGLLDVRLGAYGSDHVDRDALVPIALQRAGDVLGEEVDAGDTWVIGDTPRDLACARAGGARCLLVATGVFPLAELGALGADAVVEDLRDTAGLVALLSA